MHEGSHGTEISKSENPPNRYMHGVIERRMIASLAGIHNQEGIRVTMVSPQIVDVLKEGCVTAD